ncbi:DUF4328 domain-containing protein [Cohnella caldifontis]|uniref:DUF4328 domain-containing protein n=1 Tax=Cohnella caldifontis TaxID=3027471 RepID=UPI0023EA9DFE|nr:DUF4328 domain-containing protein [Cohnella sp. YIM B05605]
MKLKSDTISGLLKILLSALVVLQTADLLSTIVYSAGADFFSDKLYPVYEFIGVALTVLYYIVLVLYLVWLYRVHMDLNRLFPRYPRTPGGALACTIVPFYNLYGIPSIYNMIGTHFQTETARLRKAGAWVSGMAVPLLIVIMASNGLNRAIQRADDPSNALLLATSVVDLISYLIYLALCRWVSQGLSQVHADSVEVMYEDQSAAVEETVAQEG